MSIEGSELTGMGSVKTAAGTPIGSGGLFPGFGAVPPPNVASSSALGGSGLAAQSDHTHGLDIVAYTPSLVGMQATGLVAQTYSGGTATPSVSTLVADQIVYGASTGLPASSANAKWVSASNILRLQRDASDFLGQIDLRDTRGGSDGAAQIDFNGGGFPSGGLPGALLQWGIASTSSQMLHFLSAKASGATTAFDSEQWLGGPSFAQAMLIDLTFGNIYIGLSTSLATNATKGFVYLPSTTDVPSGVPTFGTGSSVPGSRVATQIDRTNERFYGFMPGSNAWKFAPLATIDANGAVATAMSSVGPTGSHTTIQEWLKLKGSGGADRWIPMF